MKANKQNAPEVLEEHSEANTFNTHKDNTFLSISNTDFADIYESQNGWNDPMPLLRQLALTLEKRLNSYMIRPDARPDIVERNSNELQMIVKCYFSLLGIDLPTFKLASDAIREALKSTPKASTAIIYVPLKFDETNQSVFVDLSNRTIKIG